MMKKAFPQVAFECGRRGSVAMQVAEPFSVLRIVEMGEAVDVIDRPAHPYTRALIASLPGGLAGGQTTDADLLIGGDPQSPIDPDAHRCRLFGRCPRGVERCHTLAPPLREISRGRAAACHFVGPTEREAFAHATHASRLPRLGTRCQRPGTQRRKSC